LTPDQRRLLDALVDQWAAAIERLLLVEDMDPSSAPSSRIGCARRCDLPISHDLKTPLASVLGADFQRCAISPAGLTDTESAICSRRDRRIRTAQPLHRQLAPT